MWTMADLKEWLDVERSLEHDDLLSDLEGRAVDIVEALTGRHWSASGSVTEYFSGTGEPILWLENPASSITSVYTRDAMDEAWELESSADYESDSDRRLYWIDDEDAGWPVGTRNIKVTYVRGYTEGSEPSDVRQLVLDLVRIMYREGRKFSPSDLPTDLIARIPGATETIARYRRPIL